MNTRNRHLGIRGHSYMVVFCMRRLHVPLHATLRLSTCFLHPQSQVAFAGFAVQALVTRQGPIANLTSHVSDPFGSNIGANIMKLPETLAQ